VYEVRIKTVRASHNDWPTANLVVVRGPLIAHT